MVSGIKIIIMQIHLLSGPLMKLLFIISLYMDLD